MENCPQGHPLKKIPAGVSKKTGKPYEAFVVCSQCDWKPARVYSPSNKVAQVTQMQENKARLINQAMDRKEESISKFNALNSAISLVTRHPNYGYIKSEDELLQKIFALQLRFFTHNSRSLEYDVDVPTEPLPESEY